MRLRGDDLFLSSLLWWCCAALWIQGRGGFVFFVLPFVSLPFFIVFSLSTFGLLHWHTLASVGVGICFGMTSEDIPAFLFLFREGSVRHCSRVVCRGGAEAGVVPAWEMSGAELADGNSLAVGAAVCFRVWSIVGGLGFCWVFGQKNTAGFWLRHLE